VKYAADDSGFRKQLPETLVAIELGRYMVASWDLCMSRFGTQKSRGKIFLITDSGMHHHLAASGNLGQVIRERTFQ
jgi:diaminopimelate decarboxylase